MREKTAGPRGSFAPIKVRADERASSRARILFCAVALMVVATTAVGAISASADRSAGATRSTKLVGSWMVSVDRGPGMPALKSLQTYTGSRNVVETANGGATARSASHGAWQRLGGRTYATTVVFFRYDPATGAYAGTVKLRHTISVSQDGQSFTGVSVPEFRDPAGNLLPGSNSRQDAVRGERINVEPISD